jgi:hypothetical protein
MFEPTLKNENAPRTFSANHSPCDVEPFDLAQDRLRKTYLTIRPMGD